MADYWREQFDATTGMYKCPWCERELKPKISQSEKNPGRQFVSCAKDYGGCGLFSFTDAKPNDKFKPKKRKVDGAYVMGTINNDPSEVEKRVAELATEVSGMRSDLREIMQFVKEVTDN